MDSSLKQSDAKFLQKQQSQDRLDQKNQPEDELKNQVSRRSRKDTQGRDFVCGCGKRYLSYPALYTHIKTKHDGVQPEGTQKYSTAAPAKKSKTKLEEEHITELCSLVQRLDMKLLDHVGDRFKGPTPMGSRLKAKILNRQIMDQYHFLLKVQTTPLKLTKQSSLEQHLVAFLLGVGEFVCQKLHQQYQWFARTARQCYYQKSQQVYNRCFSRKENSLCYISKFKVENGKYFPLICDFYVRFYLLNEHSQLNGHLMELILTEFCQWLTKRKCTFIQIILNKQFKLLTPLQLDSGFKQCHHAYRSKQSPQIQEKQSDQKYMEDFDLDRQMEEELEQAARDRHAMAQDNEEHSDVNDDHPEHVGQNPGGQAQFSQVQETPDRIDAEDQSDFEEADQKEENQI